MSAIPALSPPDSRYVLMPIAQTYGLGIRDLRDSYARGEIPDQPTMVVDYPGMSFNGKTVPRPLTFKETIEARVNDYESVNPGNERLRLFRRWISSCTGVAYKARSTKFKLVSMSQELAGMTPGHVGLYEIGGGNVSPWQYEKLAVPELDSSKGIYNKLLTKGQLMIHSGWRAAVEGDIALLRACRDIVFAEKGGSQLMGFCVRQNTSADELTDLQIGILDTGSSAYGDTYLNNRSSFLQVIHHDNEKRIVRAIKANTRVISLDDVLELAHHLPESRRAAFRRAARRKAA